jgi:hypothetical protein
MRTPTLDQVDRWTRRTGIVALAALAWTIYVPAGAFWTGVVTSCLISSAVATALLVHRRAHPTLAQLIAASEPATFGGDASRRRS